MKTNHYKQQSIKLLGFITLACFSLFLSSCGTENDENFEMPSEEVLERVSAATEVAGKYFSECNSITELKQHLDEIRSTEGVVDVWTDDQTMYVEYEGWGIMPYYYPDYSDDKDLIVTRSIDELTINNAKTSKTRSNSTRAADNVRIEKTHYRLNDLEKHSMVIYDVFSNDEQTLHLFGNEQDLVADFIKMGYEVNYVNKQNPCNDFFRRAIYDYDLIYLKTHGSYTKRIDPTTNEDMKKHWLMTGIYYESGPRTNLGFTPQQIVDLKKKGLGISTPFTEVFSYKEKVNGQIQNSLYWLVSEDGLAALSGHFVKPSIIFSSACRSLEESNTIGDIFCNKGAACYLGYDKKSRIKISSKAAYYFFEGLLNGMTVQSSYDKLESIYQCDNEFSKAVEVEPGNGGFIKGDDGLFYPATDGTGNYNLTATNARLTIVTKDNNEDDKHVCITHPQTDSYEDKDNNYYVKLKGHIKIANPDNNNEYGFALRDKNSKFVKPLKPGIKYSDADISTGNCSYNRNTNTLNFECIVDKIDFKDVDQFCAYLYDGERYCLGDLMDINIEIPDVKEQGYAVLDNTGTLTFKYGIMPDDNNVYDCENNAWPSDKINRVVFDPSFAKARPTSTSGWFMLCEFLIEILGMDYLNTSNVTDMSSMFHGCSSLLYLHVGSFNTSNVTDMGGMFMGCSNLTNLNLGGFDTSKVTDMSGMFQDCSNLTSLELGSFDTRNVTDMSNMFCACSKMRSLNLSSFRIDSATDLSGMFLSCSSLNNIDLSSFKDSKVIDMSLMFSGCTNLESVNLSNFHTKELLTTHSMFSSCTSLTAVKFGSLKFGNNHKYPYLTTRCDNMFFNCIKLKNIDLSNFDTSNVETLEDMFYECSSLTNVDFSEWETSSVRNMNRMFYKCEALQIINLSSFDTSNVKNMRSMFDYCTNLETIYAGNKWKTTQITPKQYLFRDCKKLVGGEGTAYNDLHTDTKYARIDGGPDAPGYLTKAPE